ncbi:MAG TPA: SIMPL domain-containing protein [Steroidobacteraceae bacterium]|nr:SIMPL domain-containing protein [Steroidobacteraceae bacterium]
MSLRHLVVPGMLAVLLTTAGPALADEARPRTVSVSGQGEVSAQPDMARVTLGVEARRPTLSDARSRVTATVDRVLALTRDLKIDPKYVNATRLQVQPEYRWNETDRTRVLLGYVVSRQVEIELRDLDQLGALLERAVSAGANQVGDPSLDSTKRKDLERQAMALAVQDARLNAEALAQAAGVRLGAVRALNASGSSPPMPMYRMAAVAADAAAPPPEATYQASEMKFAASVSAEYDLMVQ